MVEIYKTYDQDGFRRRAGCVCFRDQTESEVLLVSSVKSPSQWIIPSGSVEPKEELHQAAIREVAEEAGVKGTLGRCIGVFDNKEKKRRTTLYALLVTEMFDEWKDMDRGRKRKWFFKNKILDNIKPSERGWICRALQLDQ